MPESLTEADELLLCRFTRLFGPMTSETALTAAIEVEAAKKRTPAFHAMYAFQQIALERYAELLEKEENLCKSLVTTPGEVLHFTQLMGEDHA